MAYLSDLLGRGVKSIQKVLVTNNSAASPVSNYTIAAVDMGKSAVFVGTLAGSGYAGSSAVAHAKLTSGTNVAAGVGGLGDGVATVAHQVYVVDFGALVKSVQRGDLTADANSAAVALATVNPAKCIVTLYHSWRHDTHANTTHTLAANQLSITSSNAITSSWQVIEFY